MGRSNFPFPTNTCSVCFSHIAFFAEFRLNSASIEGVQWFIDIDNEELFAMTRTLFLLAAIALPFASACAAKPCEELKTEIAAKMDAKGVKDYSLEIVASDQAGDRKVVGSCDGGTNKILYSKTPATEQPQGDQAK